MSENNIRNAEEAIASTASVVSWHLPKQPASKPTGGSRRVKTLTCQLCVVIDPRRNCGIQQKAGQAQQKKPYRRTGLGRPHQGLSALRRQKTFHVVINTVV